MIKLEYENIKLGFKDGGQRQEYIYNLIKAITYEDRDVSVEYDYDSDLGVFITGYSNDGLVAFSVALYNQTQANIELLDRFSHLICNSAYEVA